MRYLTLLAALVLAASSAPAQPVHGPFFPYPKTFFNRGGSFMLAQGVAIVVSETRTSGIDSAVAALATVLEERGGASATVVPESQYDGGPSIVFAVAGVSDELDELIGSALVAGESLPTAGGYVVDVRAGLVVIGAADVDAMFSAVSTIEAMTSTGSIEGYHVWDYPDFPYRWVFNMQNLRGAGAIGRLRSILDTMSRYKLNALQQNDFKYNVLQLQPPWYFDSVEAYRAMSLERGIGIIPGVAGIGYSEGILWHDPNLAEGLPATARYVIAADTGRIVPDPRVSLPNGGFESIDGNGRFTGWSYYDESTVTVDHSIFHGGSTSARCSNFNGANSRFIRNVQCRPNSAYVMTAWLRTEDLRGGELRLLAIGNDGSGGSRVLAYTMYGLSGTSNGFRQVQVVFNTLEYEQMYLYVGLWGGQSGTFWVDDFEIRENGLANVLRRGGTPLHVRSVDGSTEYVEGTDFEPVVDARLANGVYPWHQPPTFRRRSGGALADGDTVDISFFHPVTTYGNEDGIGQVMVCLSEDTLYAILRDQIMRVDSLYSSDTYFIHHDEIRVLNRDSACLARDMSPAALLADNVERCVEIVDDVHPGATIFAWSDMFDSLHNAVDDYFLVNGDLRGVWNMIPKTLTIANWNSGRMRESLDFFSTLGFDQIAAPYYDERGTRNIRAWRLELDRTPGAKGMLYTTWVGDYSHLRPFAYYVWGAGPNLSHTPLDTGVLDRPTVDSVGIEAIVWDDPYDTGDSIVSVIARIEVGATREDVRLRPTGAGDRYVGYSRTIARDGFRYSITATNSQGIERVTPTYIVARAASSGIVQRDDARFALTAQPNPIDDAGAVTFVAPESGEWTLELVDALARVVHVTSGSARRSERIRVAIDAGDVTPGTYRCVVRQGDRQATTGVVVR